MTRQYLDTAGLTRFWNNIKGQIGHATSEQVDAWLDAHPEATTTVQDNSINGATKLIDGSVPDSKLVQSGGVLENVSSLINSLGWKATASDFTWEIGYQINVTGEKMSHTGFALSAPISTSDKKIFINNGSGYGYENKADGLQVNEYSSSDVWLSRTSVAAGELHIVGSDCAYVRLAYGYAYSQAVTMTSEILNEYFTAGIIAEAETRANALATKNELLQTIEDTSYVDLLSLAAYRDGKYAYNNSGSLVIDSSNLSGLYVVNVSNLQSYEITINTVMSGNLRVIEADQAGNVVNSASGTGSLQTITWTISEGSAFLYVSILKNHLSKAKISLKNKDLAISNLITNKNPVLSDKKLCVYGDSLASDGYSGTNTWIDIVGNYYGFGTVYNRGENGSFVTMEDATGTERSSWGYINSEGYAYQRTAFTSQQTNVPSAYSTEIKAGMCGDERVATIPTDTDVLIIEAGVNDWMSTTQVSDAGAELFRTSYETMLSKIITRIPHAKIFCCVCPYYKTGDNNTYSANFNKHRELIRESAKKYGCTVIDLRADMGVNVVNVDDYSSDGLHYYPKAGKDRMANTVIGAIDGYINTFVAYQS